MIAPHFVGRNVVLEHNLNCFMISRFSRLLRFCVPHKLRGRRHSPNLEIVPIGRKSLTRNDIKGAIRGYARIVYLMTEDKYISTSMPSKRCTAGGRTARAAARAEVHLSDGETRPPYAEMTAPTPRPTIEGTALCLNLFIINCATRTRQKRGIGKSEISHLKDVRENAVKVIVVVTGHFRILQGSAKLMIRRGIA